MPAGQSTNGLPKAAQVYCRVERLPFRGGSFDAVLCTQVLEHVPDPSVAIAEASRVLSPDGRLILTIPFVAAEHEEPHDYFRFTQFGIRTLLEAHGFECEFVKKQFGFWPTIGEMLYWHFHRKVQGGRWEKYWYAFGTTIFLGAFHLCGRFDRDDKLALNLCVVARRKGTAAGSAAEASGSLAAD